MNDVKTARSGNLSLLWAGAILFVLFGLQTAYQIYQINREHLEVDEDLSAELADAEFLEDASAEGDWPQWRGPNRDGCVRMAGFSTPWSKGGPPLLWQKPLGLGYSSFAVKDGRFYSLFQEEEKEVVACWRVADGEEVWRHAYECHARVADYPGPRSTPTLDGDRLYSVGSDGKLLCLDAAGGSLHWQKDLLKEFHASAPKWGVAFSPLIDDGLVYTCPGGRYNNSLVAFNKINGEMVWKGLDEAAGYSSPLAATIAGTRQIIFFMGQHLVAVRASDGKLCWRFPWTTNYDVNAATPIFFRARHGEKILHYVFISSGYARGCVLLRVGQASPSPASSAGGKESRVRTTTGFEVKKVYAGKQLCSHFASPVRRGEYLFGIDDSRLVCMSLRTGKVLWTRPGIKKGSLLRLNDYLLVLFEEGKLMLVDATAEKWSPLAEARPFRHGRCWTMPVVADGKLFLRNEEEMKCFDLRKQAGPMAPEKARSQ